MSADIRNTNEVSTGRRTIAMVALVLTLGFATVFVLSSSRPQTPRLSLHFTGFTNTGVRIEALFGVSNHPGGCAIQVVSIDRKDESRWIRESTSSIPVVPHLSPVMGRPFSRLPPAFVGVPMSTSNSSMRIVLSVQECKRGVAGWAEGIQETVLHVDTGTGLN